MVKIFSKRIIELRTMLSLSRCQVAKEIGVTPKAVELWEKNINEPKASNIIALSKFFDVSSDYLLGLEN